MDGWELCRQVRAAYDVPLLMLTAKGETSDKFAASSWGRRLLVKPFEPLELVCGSRRC